jgi:hypothetical protein
MVVEGLSVEELDQTPLLWEYRPVIMLVREGAQSALETKALRKPMPWSLRARFKTCQSSLTLQALTSQLRAPIG